MTPLAFEEVIQDASGGNAKVPKGEYQSSGLFPIIDQGQEFIGGYTDDRSNLVSGNGPWIVFGDHTRALKYVDFPFCMGADGVKVLKLKDAKKADLKYVHHFLKSADIPSAGYSRHYKFLKRLEIPLPPLDEQKQIAAILDKADQLRQKRRQAIALLDSLTQSIFLEMFGDPVSNPMGLKRLDLISVARFTSGATPSKGVPEFWEGSIPWVSPKDMKVNEIYDAEDHVSVSALQQTNLKSIEPNTTLIVVRGMILAHTVPLAVTKLPVTINQDMKAVVFSSDIHPMVGFWNLKVQADYILSQISTAAHGTKKLDMEILEKLPILVPPSEKQNAFVAASAKVVETVKHHLNSSRDLDVNFASLQHRAFAGQL